MNKVVSVDEVLPAVNVEAVETAVKEIQLSWTKTIHALIETAKLLHKFKQSSDWSTIRQTLNDRKIIDISVQDILIGVGSNPTLTDSRYRDLLPPHYNNLGFLSRINGKKLVELLEKKEINPSTTLADAKILALKFGSLKKPQKPRDKGNKATKVSLHLTFDSKVDEKHFVKMLVEFIDQYDDVKVKVN